MYSSIVSQASLGGLTGGAANGDGIPPGPGAPLATRQLHRPFCGRHEPTTYPRFLVVDVVWGGKFATYGNVLNPGMYIP